MKILMFNSTAAILAAFIGLTATLSAQSGSRTPDLVITACKVQKTAKDELNVIWSITNRGTADAQLLGANNEQLVSYQVEGSSKKEAAGVRHTWQTLVNTGSISTDKKILKPGESLSIQSILPHVEQDNLVSYRVTLTTDRLQTDGKKDNNSIIAILIGL